MKHFAATTLLLVASSVSAATPAPATVTGGSAQYFVMSGCICKDTPCKLNADGGTICKANDDLDYDCKDVPGYSTIQTAAECKAACVWGNDPANDGIQTTNDDLSGDKDRIMRGDFGPKTCEVNSDSGNIVAGSQGCNYELLGTLVFFWSVSLLVWFLSIRISLHFFGIPFTSHCSIVQSFNDSIINLSILRSTLTLFFFFFFYIMALLPGATLIFKVV